MKRLAGILVMFFLMVSLSVAVTGTTEIIISDFVDMSKFAAGARFCPTSGLDYVSTDGTNFFYNIGTNRKSFGSASEKSWAFKSRDASTGTNYIGGFYKFATSDNDFAPSITFGTADAAYGAHFFLVAAPGITNGTDTVIRVTGTSVTDSGVRTTNDTQDLTVDDAGASGVYYETAKKWIGQVTVAKQSGPDLLCNHGYCKYWDNNNNDFGVIGFEATWLGAANDNNPDIKLLHHKSSGWTYKAGSEPITPAPIASLVTDYDTEIKIRNNEEGAWKRVNLNTSVAGSGSEGTMIEIVTTANKAYAIGNFMMRIRPD